MVNTIATVQTVNSSAKIVVSSILPRKSDKVVNIIIKKTNDTLSRMCTSKGYHYMNNDHTSSKMVHQMLHFIMITFT